MTCPHCAAELPDRPPRFCPACALALGSAAPEAPEKRPQRCRECGRPTTEPTCPSCNKPSGVGAGEDESFTPNPGLSGLREIDLPGTDEAPLELDEAPPPAPAPDGGGPDDPAPAPRGSDDPARE